MHTQQHARIRFSSRITALVVLAGALAGCEQDADDVYDDAAMTDAPAVTSVGTTRDTGEFDDEIEMPEEEIDLPVAEDADFDDEEGRVDSAPMGLMAASPISVDQGVIEEVRVGEPFMYTLTVRNNSDAPVHGVNLTPVSTSNVRLDSQSENGESSDESSGQEQKFQVGTLGAGESRQVKVKMVAQEEGPIRACLAVDYDPVVCAYAEAVQPDLRVQRLVPEQAYICDDLTVIYVVTNTGSGTTDPVMVNEELPEGLEGADGSRTVTLDLGPIGPGDEIRREVRLRASRGGEFESRALAETGSLTAESRATAFRVLDPELDLKVSGPNEEYLDRSITYTVTVSNVSDDPAPETVVTMPVPQNTERPSFSGDVRAENGRFVLGTLGPNETREFSVTFTGVEPGTISATATAEAYCAQAVSEEISTNVKGIAALRVEAIDLVDPVPVGEQTTYLVQLKNQGTAKSINVRATGELPDGLTFDSAEGATEVTHEGGTVTFAPIQELAPGDVVEWRVTCTADAAGKERFKLTVESDATKRKIVEFEPTTLY